MKVERLKAARPFGQMFHHPVAKQYPLPDRSLLTLAFGCKATLYLHDHRSASCPNSQQLHSRRAVHKTFQPTIAFTGAAAWDKPRSRYSVQLRPWPSAPSTVSNFTSPPRRRIVGLLGSTPAPGVAGRTRGGRAPFSISEFEFNFYCRTTRPQLVSAPLAGCCAGQRNI